MYRALLPFFLVAAAALAALVAACGDNCTGIDCGPAPMPLQVLVMDTVTIDTTIQVRRLPDTTQTIAVDTSLVFIRPTTDAIVTLRRVSGADTVTFDTLRVDSSLGGFVEDDVAKLDGDPFFIASRRGTRSASLVSARLKRTQGCCSYPIVGLYKLQIVR